MARSLCVFSRMALGNYVLSVARPAASDNLCRRRHRSELGGIHIYSVVHGDKYALYYWCNDDLFGNSKADLKLSACRNFKDN